MDRLSRKSLAISIFEAIRFFQRRNRFISGAQNSPFGLVASHILIEISGSYTHSAHRLQGLLLLNKSSISRSLAELERAKIVKTGKNSEDSRIILLKCTPKGQKLVEQGDREADSYILNFEKDFNRAQKLKFRQYIAEFSQGLKIPKGVIRDTEHILRPEIRCFTRALGLLSDDVLGSKLSVVQWHILSELNSSPGISAIKIGQLLKLARPSVSLTLARLERMGLIYKKNDPLDARKYSLFCSVKGQRKLKELHTLAIKKLLPALSSFNDSELKAFSNLFKIFSGQKQPNT